MPIRANVQDVNVVGFLGETGIDAMGSGMVGRNREIDAAIKQVQTSIKPVLSEIEKTFEKIGAKLKADIAGVIPGGRAGEAGDTTTSARTKVVGGLDKSRIASALASGGDDAAALAGRSGIGTKMLGGLGRAMASPIAGAAFGAMNAGISAANNRFASGREGVLEADRMSVLYQQMTGMNQLDVSSQYRMPLTNYRLGAGGINALMGMEATIGIQGRNQASSVEAMRTLSGYSLSTSDITGMMGTLASAPVANRMFMMTGMGLIGPGGTQNSMMQVMQNIVRTAGLTNKDLVDSAMLPGSMTRAKLTMMGVPPEMQTQVLQYAKANLAYKEKGGKGMYDPSREQSRRLMGIEENFATQVEETQRLETRRGETFYRRQVDNYAALERQTQTLTRAFGALEDQLSGILGFTAQNRIATSVMSSIGGLGKFMGDGGAEGNNKSATTPLASLPSATKNSTSFKFLHPKMQERVARMMMDNPKLRLSSGYRTAEQQRSLFLSNYTKVSSPKDPAGNPNIQWNGEYYQHTSGNKVAPPGRSMHEIGLAADIFEDDGSADWVQQNAGKYGLKAFDPAEPWHVQPSELPNARSEYEKSGASWGHGTGGYTPFDTSTVYEGTDHSGHTSEKTITSVGGSRAKLEGGSISERVSRGISGSGSSSGGSSSSRRSSKSGVVKSSAGTSVINNAIGNFANGGTARSGVDIEKFASDFLRSVGAPVSRANLEAISAWIQAENTRASFNPFAVVSKPIASAMGGSENLTGWTDFNSTGVKNFANYEQGLKMSVYHMTNYGKRVIKALQSGTSNPYDIISAVEKMVSGWSSDYAARRVLESRHVPTNVQGDGMSPAPSSGGGVTGMSAMSVTGGTTVNISPVIHMTGNGSPADMQRLAREIAEMVRREMELQNMRSN